MQPKRFLFCSLDAVLIAVVAWQVSREGHDVRDYIGAESDGEIGDGSVEKPEDWEENIDWADVIVFDDIWVGDDRLASYAAQTGRIPPRLPAIPPTRSKEHRVGGRPSDCLGTSSTDALILSRARRFDNGY